MGDERMAKKINDGKVSVKRDRGRPRLTFENKVPVIQKKVERTVAFGTPISLTTPLGIKREALYVCMYENKCILTKGANYTYIV